MKMVHKPITDNTYTYSYTRGEKIGEMLFKKMFHVDYNGYCNGMPSWIQVEHDERNHINRLSSYYRKSNDMYDWNKLLAYHNELDNKYLPHSISEYIDINENINIKEFKDGLIDYLWDTDFCSYSLDNPKITIDDNIVTVELVLGK